MHLFPLVKEEPELHYKHMSTVGVFISNHKQVWLKIISWKTSNDIFLLN